MAHDLFSWNLIVFTFIWSAFATAEDNVQSLINFIFYLMEAVSIFIKV